MNLTLFTLPIVAFAFAGCIGDAPDPTEVTYKTSDTANADGLVQTDVNPPVGGLHDGMSSDGANPNNSVGR
jgi:hypothetical protein